MLTSEIRSQLYWDCARVVGEMANAYNVFSGSLLFNPEMAQQYKANRAKYVTYFTNIVRHIDCNLQEDQLTCTRLGFPLVSVPTYLPNQYELEQNDMHCIDKAVHAETREAEHDMQVIMDKDHHNNTHSSVHTSFSRLRSFKQPPQSTQGRFMPHKLAYLKGLVLYLS